VVIFGIAAISVNPHFSIGTYGWVPDVVLVGAVHNEFAVLHCTSNAAIEWSSGYNTSDLKFRKQPVYTLLSGPILCNSKFRFLTMFLEVMIWVLGSGI